jgi:branched-chain amino acid transport system ATP-binding protein
MTVRSEQEPTEWVHESRQEWAVAGSRVGAGNEVAVRDLTVRYGGVTAVNRITISLAGRRRIAALVGANGAGKSSVLKAMCGLVPASDGVVSVGGQRLDALEAFQISRAGVKLIPERRELLGSMTVEENLEVARRGGLTSAPRRRELDELVFGLFPVLYERRSQAAGTLSGGQQQMLAVGRALVGDPRVILADEVSMGLAPVLVDHMLEAFKKIAGEGIRLLVVEQFVDRVLDIADHVYVLRKGQITFSGPSSELDGTTFNRAYFGIT